MTRRQLPILDTHICALQVISVLHRRFPMDFTPALITALASSVLAPSNKAALAAMVPERREKEDAARVTQQRLVIRVCTEFTLVGVVCDALSRRGEE